MLPPQVPVSSSTGTVGILKCAKREVGVGTSSEDDRGSNHTQEGGGTLVNIAKKEGEAPKGEHKTKEGKKRQNPPPPPKPHPKKSSAIGTSGALSGSRNDNDDSTQGRIPSSLMLAPLAEMEGASSLESSSTFASSSKGERNGATNQSVARKSKSPSPPPPNSHQSGKRLSSSSTTESADPQSIKRDAFTKEGGEGEGERLMGANEGKGGVNEEEEEEDACSGSDLDVTCTTVAEGEGEETEEDLEAVGERARMIYKELEDAFSSLDQKDSSHKDK